MVGVFILNVLAINVSAQDLAVERTSPKNADSLTIWNALEKGKWQPGFRYYFMSTNNTEGLTDYHAHAAAAHLKYETAPWKGFKAGIGGAFVYKINASDLTRPDSSTGKMNRYEIGLFDVEYPKASTLARWEELYLSYTFKNTTIKAGRQFINTPFINPQDGRMRPNAVSGAWMTSKVRYTQIEVGFINALSPRSTCRWFSVGNSIGLYPQGLNEDGSKSAYAGQLKSNGILVGGISRSFPFGVKLQLWNQYVVNIFNTILLQADTRHKIDSLSGITAGLQVTTQQKVNNGGSENKEFAYFSGDRHPLVISTKLGWNNRRWDLSVNYTRITDNGRYLMPREWGKDPFYTFMPRERNSGYGDVNAWVGKMMYTLPGKGSSLSLDAGYFDMPDLKDYRLNKFGMPSYYQLNAELKHQFKKVADGLDLKLLYVYKKQSGNSRLPDKNVINKVNMSLYSVIVNYEL